MISTLAGVLTQSRGRETELNSQYEVPGPAPASLHPSQREPGQVRNVQDRHQEDHPGCSQDGEVCRQTAGGSEQEHSAEIQHNWPGKPTGKVYSYFTTK